MSEAKQGKLFESLLDKAEQWLNGTYEQPANSLSQLEDSDERGLVYLPGVEIVPIEQFTIDGIELLPAESDESN